MVEVTFEEHQADLAKELETIGLLEAVMKRLSELNGRIKNEQLRKYTCIGTPIRTRQTNLHSRTNSGVHNFGNSEFVRALHKCDDTGYQRARAIWLRRRVRQGRLDAAAGKVKGAGMTPQEAIELWNRRAGEQEC